MKANSVNIGINIANIPSKQLIFRSENITHAPQNGHDEFVSPQKESKSNKAWWITSGLIFAGIIAFFAHKSGWLKKTANKLVDSNEKFKNISDAKKYFEDLGIDTEFRDINTEHLPLLDRIKNDLIKLKNLGVKIDKPNTLTISDWHKAEEFNELCRKRGISVERIEEYHALCVGDEKGASHVFINSSKPNTDYFRHEMGHANHQRGHDSFWEAKGLNDFDFADKQLELLGSDNKIFRNTGNFHNIFHFNHEQSPTKFIFPNQNMETRFVYVKNIVNKIQEETSCYKPDSLSEQVAYVFDGLAKGDKFSDEVMLYYDFAGGARIPNLKINGKTYDEYIESLYSNPELIQKLRENVKICKI